MKRTPPWVFVAAAAVQLAALGLCLWAMDHIRRLQEADAPAPEPAPSPEPAAPVEALAPPAPPPEAAFVRAEAPPPTQPEPQAEAEASPSRTPSSVTVRAVTLAELAEHRFGEPPPAPEPRYFEPEPPPARAFEAEPYLGEPPRPKPSSAMRVQPSSPTAPLFGAPPARPPQPPPEPNGVPHFITELADATTQIVRGRVADGRFAFGFYPDGNIRFVDVDGGRYAGKAESARARMREVDGTRAFTVQIGVAADGRLQASFTGGTHDAETIALEPSGGSAA